MGTAPRVGEILVGAGVIDELQLKSALAEQDKFGLPLGATLIHLGMVDERTLVQALAGQFDLPVASLAGKRIPADVLALVPARVADHSNVLPLFVKREGRVGQLYIGMSDPSNLEVLDDLAFRTGLEVQPVMVAPTELTHAIDYFYRGNKPPRNDPARPEETLGFGNLVVLSEDDDEVEQAPVEASDAADRVLPPSAQPAQDADTLVEAPAYDPSTGPAAAPAATVSGAVASPPTAASAPASAESGVGDRDAEIEALKASLEQAIQDTVATRMVVKSLVQLLAERGALELPEIQERVAQLKEERSASEADGAASSASDDA